MLNIYNIGDTKCSIRSYHHVSLHFLPYFNFGNGSQKTLTKKKKRKKKNVGLYKNFIEIIKCVESELHCSSNNMTLK